MKESLSKYIPVAEAISKIFKPHVEVVIHNIESDLIEYIANPYSGRKVGDSSLLGLFEKKNEKFPHGIDVEGPYENAGNQGQRIRSISSALKDDQGKVVGIMCINVDFSVMEASLDVLETFLKPLNVEAPPRILFQNDWRDNIKLEIRTFLVEHNIGLDKIEAKYRKKLIRRLEDKGLFYARKSIEQLAIILGISRATAYNDLRQVRKEIKSES
jgi:predicted transcriptional regulator YheO